MRPGYRRRRIARARRLAEANRVLVRFVRTYTLRLVPPIVAMYRTAWHGPERLG